MQIVHKNNQKKSLFNVTIFLSDILFSCDTYDLNVHAFSVCPCCHCVVE